MFELQKTSIVPNRNLEFNNATQKHLNKPISIFGDSNKTAKNTDIETAQKTEIESSASPKPDSFPFNLPFNFPLSSLQRNDIKTSNQLNIQPQDQGNNNSCGTTSLSMILNYFGINVSNEQLDKEIRKTNSFTSPELLVKAAEDRNINASIYNNSDFTKIKENIDNGNGLIALIDSGKRQSDASLHYVVIKGYNELKDGSKELIILNPASGNEYPVKYDEFAENKWNNTDVFNINTGINNLLIAFSNKNNLESDELNGKSKDSIRIATGINQISNSWGSAKKGKIFTAAKEIAVGSVNTVVGATKFLGRKVAQGISNAADSIGGMIKKLKFW